MKKIITLLVAIVMLFGSMTAMAGDIVRCQLPGQGLAQIDIAVRAAGHKGHQVDSTNTVAQYFDIGTSELLSVSLCCPSFSDNVGSMDISVFKWAGSVEETVKTKAIATKTFVDFADSEVLVVDVPAGHSGEFMIYAHNGTQKVGVWLELRSNYAQKTFINGVQAEGSTSLRSSIKVNGNVQMQKTGTERTETRDAYSRITATDYDSFVGKITRVETPENKVDAIGTKDYIRGHVGVVVLGYDKVDFGNTSPKGVKFNAFRDSMDMQKLQIVLDDPTNVPVAELKYDHVERFSEWKVMPAKINASITGVHDVYVVAYAPYQDSWFSWFEFTREEPGLAPIEQRLADFKDDPEISYDDMYADTWSATDMLGRKLPGNETVGDPNPDKQVAMFYWSWHVGESRSAATPLNVNNFVKKYPHIQNDYKAIEWDSDRKYYWNESVYGYYTGHDHWVLRKQFELLGSAGVDGIFFDTSNGSSYTTGAMQVAEVMHEMHLDGIKTPGMSFIFGFNNMSWNDMSTRNVYETFYQNGLYSDTWYYWDGKPVLMAYPDPFMEKTGYEDIDKQNREILDFFTFRPGQAEYRGGPRREDQWPWLEVYPQHPYGKSDKYGCECVCVGIAQNTSDKGILVAMNGKDVYGRSYTYKDKFSKLNENSKLYGYNFQEQWERAFELDPELVFVTGWNEYTMGRREFGQDTANAFSDQFNDEYSRDIEPVKGDLKDVYYYQLVSNIRRFKGVRPTPEASKEKTIDINGDFAQWGDVGPEFKGYIGGVEPRNMDGVGGINYTNNTGRNDIVLSKVARDKENLYFYVETAENLTPYTDSDWMRLFINTDRKNATGWEGYDFVINNISPTAEKAFIQKHNSGEWKWKDAGELDYKVQGNKMMIKVPKAILGINGDKVDIEFKWNDNMLIEGDIMDFYINGDTAPIGRYNYRYVTDTSNDTTPENEYLPIKRTAADVLENHTVMMLDNPQAFRDGEIVAIDSANPNITPKIINDKTMVPLRFVSESLGAEVEWNERRQMAAFRKAGITVQVTVDSDEMLINKTKVKLQSPATLIDDRIFVPLRDVAEALETQVLWQEPGMIIVGDEAYTVLLENDEAINVIERAIGKNE